MQYVEKEDELVGKTISKIINNNYETLFLIFTDDSWTALESTQDYYDGGLERPRVIKKSEISYNEEFTAGVITQEELLERQAKELKLAQRRNTERQKREYEKLKAIFEKSDEKN